MPFFLFLWCSLDKLRQAKLLFFLFIQASPPPQWFPWGDTVRFVGVPGQNLSLSQYRVCFMANLSWKCHFHWVMSKASFPARVVLGCSFVSFFTQFCNLLTCWRKLYFNWMSDGSDGYFSIPHVHSGCCSVWLDPSEISR